jgi:ABC-type sugar transport system substrate-binding protein
MQGLRARGQCPRRSRSSQARHRFLRRAAGASLLVAAVLVVAGSGFVGYGARQATAAPDRGANSKVIAVDLPFIQADVYPPLIAGAKQEAAKRGYKILQSSSQLDLNTQLTELHTWIAENIAAITAYPLDLNSFGPIVQQAHSHNELFIAYGVSVPGADGSTLFNEKQASRIIGTAAGKYIKNKLHGKAQVGLLVQAELETSRLRVNRAVTWMHRFAPKAKVVAHAEAAAAPDALTATRAMLQAHSGIRVLICINDQDLIGASQALRQLGRRPSSVWMGGFDGSKAAMQRILDGRVVGATAALPLKAIGRTTVAVPANILAKKGKRRVMTSYVLVTNSTKKLLRKLIADYGS